MKHFFALFKPYIILTLLLIVVTYIQVLANLRLPDYMADIINDGIIIQNLDNIWNSGWHMIAVTAIGGVSAIIAGYFAARIATGFARDLRKKLFTRVESFSVSDLNQFSTASLITRSTNDIQQIQMTVTMLLRIALMAPLMAIGGVQKSIENAPSLTWIIAVAVACLIAVVVMLFIVAIPRFKKLQELVDKLNLVTRENLTGLRVVRAFNNEKIEERKFNDVNNNLTHMNVVVNKLMMVLDPVMTLGMNVSVLAVVWFGAQLVSTEELAIGNMMAFIQYAMQVIISFLMISAMFIMVPRAAVSVKRVFKVLSTDPSVTDSAHPLPLNPDGKGRVEFKDVTFTYPDADLPVLSDITFTAEPGQTTAFIGSTGSGKSTLINLIPRFYDVTAGQILLDGIDIRRLKIEDLHSQIGYVPQKGVLFSGTVNSNIAYGAPNISESSIKHAAEIAQADEFIESLKGGYEARIAQGGNNVSGGQRQRLSIARALAIQPKVYIFDDSFSALDLKTDAALRQALEKETKAKTILVVAQRISTIVAADNIIVLNEGKIVGQGSHADLMKTCEIYREIAYSQLTEQELKEVQQSKRKGNK